eukprot:g28981.t1
MARFVHREVIWDAVIKSPNSSLSSNGTNVLVMNIKDKEKSYSFSGDVNLAADPVKITWSDGDVLRKGLLGGRGIPMKSDEHGEAQERINRILEIVKGEKLAKSGPKPKSKGQQEKGRKTGRGKQDESMDLEHAPSAANAKVA